jgi:toxin ParE1/3/4
MRLRYSKRALSDLDEIWVYLAEISGSVEVADRVLDSITQTLIRRRNNPNLGRKRAADLNPSLRSIPSSRYVVYYRISPDHVEIFRVFHGSRDARKFLT